jgi:hypothetical protein
MGEALKGGVLAGQMGGFTHRQKRAVRQSEREGGEGFRRKEEALRGKVGELEKDDCASSVCNQGKGGRCGARRIEVEAKLFREECRLGRIRKKWVRIRGENLERVRVSEARLGGGGGGWERGRLVRSWSLIACLIRSFLGEGQVKGSEEGGRILVEVTIGENQVTEEEGRRETGVCVALTGG